MSLRIVAFGLLALVVSSSSNSLMAGVINNWIVWNAPTNYGSSANLGVTNYTYAPTATGSLALPGGGSPINATFSGEVVNPSIPGMPSPSDPLNIYAGPSGFDSASGTTYDNYWSTRPAANAATYLSTNIPNYPTQSDNSTINNDHIGVVGAGNATQTLTFDSPVQNLVMVVYSLGREGSPGQWSFSQDFDILSDNSAVSGGSGFSKSGSGSNYLLTGSEGSGAIQFTGTFTQLTWTVTLPEVWASWNVGASSSPAPSAVPEPTTMGILGLGALSMVYRARRKARLNSKLGL